MNWKRLPLPLLLAGTLATNVVLLTRPAGSAAPAAPAPRTDAEVARSVSRAISEVSERVRSAVVSVRTPWLSGSGVLISSDGLIVTNFHVTGGAETCDIRLLDGRRLTGRLVAFDRDSDLALISVPGKDFEYLEFADGPEPPIGTWVLAVGNPLGFDHTVTFGIISAAGREAGLSEVVYENFLQTDAAINSGNSGGPLVDLDGRVVGINTAKEVVSGGAQGLGFAIPAEMARDVISQLADKGYVERGWFGIGIEKHRLRRGLYIESVTGGSPADRAGMERGDYLLAINGEAVQSKRAVFDQIAAAEHGHHTRYPSMVLSVDGGVGFKGDALA